MVDKKKRSKVVKKKKVGDAKASSQDKAFQKVSVYQEAKKRKDKVTFVKDTPKVSKNSKYIFVVAFGVASFFITRVLFGTFFVSDKIIVNDSHVKDECPAEYKFTATEAELLKISEFINKPKSGDKNIEPCTDFMNTQLAEMSLAQRTTTDTIDMKAFSEQLKIKGKINKLVTTNESKEEFEQRINNLSEYKKNYYSDYVRFKFEENFPEGGLYFGVEGNKVTDIDEYLKLRECTKPQHHFTNFENSHLSLFFTLNAVRGFEGKVKLVNNRYKSLIQGKMGIFEYKREPYQRYIPQGMFEMWAHKNMNVAFKGFNYQRQFLAQEYSFGWDRSPWLYNSCNKSISVVSNYCALDPRYDMQFKDFFYLIKRDVMVGNIYCKKSYEKEWSRVGTFEMVRTN